MMFANMLGAHTVTESLALQMASNLADWGDSGVSLWKLSGTDPEDMFDQGSPATEDLLGHGADRWIGVP